MSQLLKKLFSSPYVNMGDEELMRLIQRDSQEAFEELYHRYKAPLFTYFRGMISESSAEELLQETFIKVATKKQTFRFESKIKTWMWTIAKNTLRDYWRTIDHRMKNSFDPLESDTGEELFVSPLSDSEQIIIEKTTQKQLEACINELPADQKEIVLLHIQSELSHQEIAELTQVSVGAIKSVLFRSKEKLMICMKNGGHL